MLFGSKYKKLDYLYEDELMAWKADGIIEHTFDAFSRD